MENYTSDQLNGILSESDDSSFICSRSDISSSSSSQQGDFFNLETREDSFLENMCQFVKECLSSDELMTRLSHSKQTNLGDVQVFNKKSEKIINDFTGETDQLHHQDKTNRRFFRKPNHTPKLYSQKRSLYESILANKFPLLFILVSFAMIFLRAQDIRFLFSEKSKKECLNFFLQKNQLEEIVEMQQCMNNISMSISLILLDYHQLFYFSIILCALYFIIKNRSINVLPFTSYQEYIQKYKTIHNITSSDKIPLSQLLKQRAHPNQNQYSTESNHKKPSQKFMGISFGFSVLLNKFKD